MAIFAIIPVTVPMVSFTADQVLSHYIYVFYAAFLIALIFSPIMRTVANYYGIIDEPDQIRKMHSRPIAYLGGIAVFLGWMAGLAFSQFVGNHWSSNPDAAAFAPTLWHVQIDFSIVIGAAVVVILGLWDDIRGVGPWFKILIQVMAALFLLYRGIGTQSTRFLLEPLDSFLGHYHFHLLGMPRFIKATSWLLTIAIVVACCNATNLMDGLDGLCGGVTAIIALGFCFVAIQVAMNPFVIDLNRDALRIVLALSLLGAVLGFLPYNFNPASIFMGDAGSMFLGFSCATLIILAAEKAETKWFLASLVMFALPLADTVLAFARRIVNRRAVFSPDRFHFHHQLIARGLTVKQTVFIAYGFAIFFVVGGGAIAFLRTRYVVAAYLVIFGFLIVAAFKMGMVHEKPRVITRRTLNDSNVSRQRAVEPANVIDIREAQHTNESGSVSGLAGTWQKPDDSVADNEDLGIE